MFHKCSDRWSHCTPPSPAHGSVNLGIRQTLSLSCSLPPTSFFPLLLLFPPVDTVSARLFHACAREGRRRSLRRPPAAMHSFAVVASALVFAAATKAQSFATGGVGRFPCGAAGGGPDVTQCTNTAMTANQVCPADPGSEGLVDGNFKGNGSSDHCAW